MPRFLSRKTLLPVAPLALASVLVGAQPAQAILTYNIYESGGNLVVQSSGSLNLAGATILGPGQCSANGALISSAAFVCTGIPNLGTVYQISGPTSFAGSAVQFPADSVSGFSTTLSGIAGQFALEDPYTGGPISGSATFNGQTLAGLGFSTPGLIATWTIDGTSETINVVVGPPAAPGPLPLLGAGAAFGFSRRLRRRVSLSRSTSQSATSISA